MEKWELAAVNAELVGLLIGLRDQINETLEELAAVGIGGDDESETDEEIPDEDDED